MALYVIYPAWMAWSAFSLANWVRWAGVLVAVYCPFLGGGAATRHRGLGMAPKKHIADRALDHLPAQQSGEPNN